MGSRPSASLKKDKTLMNYTTKAQGLSKQDKKTSQKLISFYGRHIRAAPKWDIIIEPLCG
jgi:hypothetical protein